MINTFFPDLFAKDIWDIDFNILKDKNIKGLILDIDNTLVANFVKEIDDKALKWINNLKDNGFKVCIVSNAKKERVQNFIKENNIPYIYKAKKPSKKPFINASAIMGIEPVETAVVGDQVFTDVWGGNKLSMLTVLVEPIDNKEFIFIKFKRLLEKIVLSVYFKKRSC